MISRVTRSSMQFTALRHLQAKDATLAALLERQSSGKTITVPSDDPAGTVDALRLRSEQRANAQYTRNTNDAIGWLSTLDSTLLSTSSQIISVRDLIVQAGNGALSETQRISIASQLEASSGTLLGMANTTYMGRNIFAGTSAAESAFTDNGDGTYTWNGAAGSAVERRLGDDTTVQVDSDGGGVFGNGATSLFAVIDSFATALRSGDALDVSAALNTIDGFHSAVLSESASVGTRYNQAKAAQSAQESLTVTLKQQLSSVEDADLAETVIQVSMQQVAYQAALSATAQVLQPSLLDFLS